MISNFKRFDDERRSGTCELRFGDDFQIDSLNTQPINNLFNTKTLFFDFHQMDFI